MKHFLTCVALGFVFAADAQNQSITLNLTFDMFPTETSWEVQDVNGVTYANNSNYPNSLANESISEIIILPPGCYTLSFFDEFCDGFCCSLGQGSYSLSNSNGDDIITETPADFGCSISVPFCVGMDVIGCMDPTSCMYNPLATQDNGSCDYYEEVIVSIVDNNYSEDTGFNIYNANTGEVVASMGAGAYGNFQDIFEEACLLDNTCYYIEITDAWSDGINNGTWSVTYNGNTVVTGGSGTWSSQVSEIWCLGPGCQDPVASNFNAAATSDDGSCEYLGCTDPVACNYDEEALTDDGTCLYNSLTLTTNPAPGVYWHNGWTLFVQDTITEDLSPLYSAGWLGNEFIGDEDPDDWNQPWMSTDFCLSDGCYELVIYDILCDGIWCGPGGGCGYTLTGGGGIVATGGDFGCDTAIPFCLPLLSGCTNPTACNYDAEASTDDGSCYFPDFVFVDGCDGDCVNDLDADGICDQFDNCISLDACNYADAANEFCDYSSCLGCMDPLACNYNVDATEDDGSCLELDECGICGGNGVAEGACDCQGNLPEDFYNCDGTCLNDYDLDGVCDEEEVLGCVDEAACNFSSLATDDDGTCLFLDVCGICGGDGTTCEEECSNQDDEVAALGGCSNAVLLLGCETLWNGTPLNEICPETCQSCPCESDFNENGVCDENEVFGCTYPTACNFNALATTDDGSCLYPVPGYDCSGEGTIVGCMDDASCSFSSSATSNDPTLCYYPLPGYDCDGNCLNDTDDDGLCDEEESSGCTDYTACNYDAAATDDDGSCLYPVAGYDCSGEGTIVGCMDDASCSFSSSATSNDPTLCYYPLPGYDCDGNCLNDTDDDGICDEFEVVGCSDPEAMNYNDMATDDDGSCQFAQLGCTYTVACNYSAEADSDDGSCVFAEPGYNCEGELLEDYAGSNDCIADLDNDGVVGVNDLLALLSSFGFFCPE